MNPPPPLKLSRLAIESRRRPPPVAAPIDADAPPSVPGFPELPPTWGSFEAEGAGTDADAAVLDPDPTRTPAAGDGTAAESPGTTPAPDRRAMSARTALSHLISSSSLGAHNSSVRLVVAILKVCLPAASPSSSPPFDCWGGDVGGEIALCLCAGKSYSSASRIWVSGMERWGLVS